MLAKQIQKWPWFDCKQLNLASFTMTMVSSESPKSFRVQNNAGKSTKSIELQYFWATKWSLIESSFSPEEEKTFVHEVEKNLISLGFIWMEQKFVVDFKESGNWLSILHSPSDPEFAIVKWVSETKAFNKLAYGVPNKGMGFLRKEKDIVPEEEDILDLSSTWFKISKEFREKFPEAQAFVYLTRDTNDISYVFS